MIKKVIATAAIAASVMGASAAAAPQALAIGDDSGPTAVNGNGAMQSFGNSSTYGNMSPQMALIQGSFNKPCIAVNDLPIGVGALIGIPIQDIPILSDHQQQQCAENSTNAKRDGALAHLLEDVSILSANGE
ncbi:rodlin [Streptomyces sp. NEAU-H22]|uniref:rodlin n=1 Tax=Streptomyces TaxID=1883 RepID=UPI0022551D64|nr:MULTISPECIES: rodlin [unclassified Streptomyces]MCX3286192.1 rodlin [Streptomyces sp. NEAU-H22]WMD08844.1 rodlin [Streptomyces sp. FXY-T5]